MQFNKNKIVGNTTLKDVRDFLRKIDGEVDAATATALTKWNTKSTSIAFLEHLCELQYLRKDGEKLSVSSKGAQLVSGKLRDQLTRPVAVHLLDRIADCAETINGMRGFAHYISSLYVFGSYLTDVEDIDRLEVVVCLGERDAQHSTDTASDLKNDSIEPGASKQVHNADVIFRLLKCGRRNIVIHDHRQIDLLQLRSQRIFLASDDSARA